MLNSDLLRMNGGIWLLFYTRLAIALLTAGSSNREATRRPAIIAARSGRCAPCWRSSPTLNRNAGLKDVVRRSSPCRLDTVAAAPARAAPAPAGEDISMGRRHFSVAQCRISFPSHRVCPRSSHRLERHLAKHTLAARCGGSGVPACARAPCGAAQRRRRRRHSRSGLRHQGGQAARSDNGATRPGSAGEL